jgi:hypothetical protein
LQLTKKQKPGAKEYDLIDPILSRPALESDLQLFAGARPETITIFFFIDINLSAKV